MNPNKPDPKISRRIAQLHRRAKVISAALAKAYKAIGWAATADKHEQEGFEHAISGHHQSSLADENSPPAEPPEVPLEAIPRSAGDVLARKGRKVRMNLWGNLRGYEGRQMVREFGNDAHAARDWLNTGKSNSLPRNPSGPTS
jgi:hypothetical protein